MRDLSLSYEKLRTDSAKEIMKWQSLVASGNITNHTKTGHNSDHHRKSSPSRNISNNTPVRRGGHNSDRKGSDNEINLLRRKIITLERQLQIEKNSNNTNNSSSKHTSYTTSHSNSSIRDRDRNRYLPIDGRRPPSVPRTSSRHASPSYSNAYTNNTNKYNTHSNNYSSNIRRTSSRGRSDTPPPRRPSPTYTNNNTHTHSNNIHSTSNTNSSRPTSRTRPAQYIESLSRQGTPIPTSYRSRSSSPQIHRDSERGHNSEGKPAWGSRPNLSRVSSRYAYTDMSILYVYCVYNSMYNLMCVWYIRVYIIRIILYTISFCYISHIYYLLCLCICYRESGYASGGSVGSHHSDRNPRSIPSSPTNQHRSHAHEHTRNTHRHDDDITSGSGSGNSRERGGGGGGSGSKRSSRAPSPTTDTNNRIGSSGRGGGRVHLRSPSPPHFNGPPSPTHTGHNHTSSRGNNNRGNRENRGSRQPSPDPTPAYLPTTHTTTLPSNIVRERSISPYTSSHERPSLTHTSSRLKGETPLVSQDRVSLRDIIDHQKSGPTTAATSTNTATSTDNNNIQHHHHNSTTFMDDSLDKPSRKTEPINKGIAHNSDPSEQPSSHSILASTTTTTCKYNPTNNNNNYIDNKTPAAGEVKNRDKESTGTGIASGTGTSGEADELTLIDQRILALQSYLDKAR